MAFAPKKNKSNKQSTNTSVFQKNVEEKCEDCEGLHQDLFQMIKKTKQEKRQNDKLRDQLKEVNNQLDVALQKVEKSTLENQSLTNFQQKELTHEEKVQMLEKQLETGKKRLKLYAEKYKSIKEITEIIGIKQFYNDSEQKFYDSQEKLNQFKKDYEEGLETVKKQNLILKNTDPEQLNIIRHDIHLINLKINEAKDQKQKNEEFFEKQAKYIKDLVEQHKKVCEQSGIEFKDIKVDKENLRESRTVKLPRLVKSKNTQSLKNILSPQNTPKTKKTYYGIRNRKGNEEEEEQEKLEQFLKNKKLQYQDFEKVNKSVDIQKQNNKSKQKYLGNQNKKLENQLQELTEQNDITDKLLEERKYTLEQLQQKIKEFEEMVIQQQSQTTASKYKSFQYDKSQNNFLLMDLNSEKSLIGGVPNKQMDKQVGYEDFDNSNDLPEEKNYKIQKLIIYYFQEYILNIEVEYTLRNGKKQTVSQIQFDKEELQKYNEQIEQQNNENKTQKPQPQIEQKILNLRGHEYINQITGLYANNHIQYMKIFTSSKQYIVVGDSRQNQDSKKFTILVDKNEQPNCIFGVTTQIQSKSKKLKHLKNMQCLVQIGLKLKNKEQLKYKTPINSSRIDKINQRKGKDDEEEDEEEDEIKEEKQEEKQEKKVNVKDEKQDEKQQKKVDEKVEEKQDKKKKKNDKKQQEQENQNKTIDEDENDKIAKDLNTSVNKDKKSMSKSKQSKKQKEEQMQVSQQNDKVMEKSQQNNNKNNKKNMGESNVTQKTSKLQDSKQNSNNDKQQQRKSDQLAVNKANNPENKTQKKKTQKKQNN